MSKKNVCAQKENKNLEETSLSFSWPCSLGPSGVPGALGLLHLRLMEREMVRHGLVGALWRG